MGGATVSWCSGEGPFLKRDLLALVVLREGSFLLWEPTLVGSLAGWLSIILVYLAIVQGLWRVLQGKLNSSLGRVGLSCRDACTSPITIFPGWFSLKALLDFINRLTCAIRLGWEKGSPSLPPYELSFALVVGRGSGEESWGGLARGGSCESPSVGKVLRSSLTTSPLPTGSCRRGSRLGEVLRRSHSIQAASCEVPRCCTWSAPDAKVQPFDGLSENRGPWTWRSGGFSGRDWWILSLGQGLGRLFGESSRGAGPGGGSFGDPSGGGFRLSCVWRGLLGLSCLNAKNLRVGALRTEPQQ
jgi:hypothetical protein